jgi:hypothetical protein
MIRVFAIETGRDTHLGTVNDLQGLASLVELARLLGASGVSLHGEIGPLQYSGESEIPSVLEEIMAESGSGVHLVDRPTCDVCGERILRNICRTRTHVGDVLHHERCSAFDADAAKTHRCAVCGVEIYTDPVVRNNCGVWEYYHKTCR